jgi:hypothetical protein
MQTTNFLCAAILLSVPIYVVVAWVITASDGPGAGSDGLPNAVLWGLAAVGVAQIAVAQAVWSAMTRAAASRGTPAERLDGYRTAAIVAFALREATALFGLVLTLLTGDVRWCLALSALAALAMAVGWPRRSEMERLVADPDTRPIG